MYQDYSSGGTGNPPHLLPDGNQFLYPGCHVRKNDVLLLVVAFVLRFKLCRAACQALLALLDIIIPGCIVSSNYFVEKVLGFDNTNVSRHYFCANSDCIDYFGLTVPRTCNHCGTVYNNDADLCDNSFMLVLPIGDQLKTVLDKTSNWEYIFGSSKQQGGTVLGDVTDGAQYARSRGNADVTL